MGVIISKCWRNTDFSEAYLLCARHCSLHALTYLLSPYEDDAIIPILQIRKQVEWKGRVQGHIASKQQSQDINPGVPKSKTYTLHYTVKSLLNGSR